MEEGDKEVTLDALLQRRQVLTALYERQRLKSMNTLTRQPEDEKKIIFSESSDVIEDSDSEQPAKRFKKSIIILNSPASNSDDNTSTSIISSSLHESMFSDNTLPINTSVNSTTDKKINVISNILINKSSTDCQTDKFLRSSLRSLIENNDLNKSVVSSTGNADISPEMVDVNHDAVPPSTFINCIIGQPATPVPENLETDHYIITPLAHNAHIAGPNNTIADLDTGLITTIPSLNNAETRDISVTFGIDTASHNSSTQNIGLPDSVGVTSDIKIPPMNNIISTDSALSTSNGSHSKVDTNTLVNNADATSSSLAARSDVVIEPKKKRSAKKPFLDFLSDDDTEDYSAGSSDNWTQGNESESSENETIKVAKMKKRIKKKRKQGGELLKKKTTKVNKRKIGKKNREEGKEYESNKGKIMPDRKMKSNPCYPDHCKRGCYNITEERRASLFQFFWNLDLQRRKDWLIRSSRVVACARKRTDTPISRRNITYEYYLNNGEEHQKVCQKFVLNTLDISQKFLLYTLSKSKDDVSQKDQRQRNISNKYSEFAKTEVKQFIEKLPVVPSHYNRKNTNKVYLPQELKNISNLYRLYLKECQSSNIEFVSESMFRTIFQNDFNNISFHIPKKDKCIVCVKAENDNNLSESDKDSLQEHLKEKQATYKRFEQHQRLPLIKNDTIVCTFDLQKVLNTPYGESVILYYSRKYPVFNFTIYESITQDVYCYLWGECDAKRGANEISTCLYSYLKSVDDKGIKNILFYCDSCPGQNKNKTILSVFNYFLMKSKHLEVIQINYLLPGHTYMPVDSVHATIEREVKKITVWSPTQWPSYIEAARKNPRPYNVNVMDHSDFLNWDDITAVMFTNETSKSMRMRNIRIVTLKKKNPNEIYIKYSMHENMPTDKVTLFQKSGRRGKGKGRGKGKSRNCDVLPKENTTKSGNDNIVTMTPTLLYKNRLPISDAKYKDSKRLCDNGVIPKRYHHDYINLCHANVTDSLTLTDEDDEEELDE